MEKIIVNDKNNFYFGKEAEILETFAVNTGKQVHRVLVKTPTGGEITFALNESEVMRISHFTSLMENMGFTLCDNGSTWAKMTK